MFNSKILVGDVLVMLGTLEDASVDCVVTSPPYWGLRDYQVEGQIGLEPTLAEFVATMVKVFGEVARVLKRSGTVWLNLGDSYASGGSKPQSNSNHDGGVWRDGKHADGFRNSAKYQKQTSPNTAVSGLKPKDLCGIPWRVAFGLQDDGWYLRQEIIWHKPNPMPESVRDRCTKAHESIFLLAHPDSGGKYYYDADAVRERHKEPWRGRGEHESLTPHSGRLDDVNKEQAAFTVGVRQYNPLGRNKRSVWTITTKPYSQAHFATFPPELPRTCIQAGCPEGGTVLDPFAGAGTTLLVANQLQRHAIGIELNPEYAAMAEQRIYGEAPLLNQVAVI